jgi:predicted alpha/beta superfamily hydrolase
MKILQTRWRGVFLCLSLLVSLACGVYGAETVGVDIVVTVPDSTPAQDKVFLVGSHEELGAWAEKGLQLSREAKNLWKGRITAPLGSIVECKVSRGSWKTVEKGWQGEEVTNRRHVVEKGQLLEITVARWADSPGASPGPQPAPTHTGNICHHSAFPSKILNNQRDIWVYLPPAAAAKRNARFPVLYLHDGQNLFNARSSFGGTEWSVDETAESHIKSGKIAPVIIVAIANIADRMEEYTPVRSESQKAGGRGEAYLSFVVQELKPFIDKTYPTFTGPAHTTIGGSSLGGLISLYAAARFPEVFGGCVAMSPSIWWADRWILGYCRDQAEQLQGKKYWLDIGTREGGNSEEFMRHLNNLRDVRNVLLKQAQVDPTAIGYAEVKDGTHSEGAWAARFGLVLRHLYPVTR